MTKATSYVFIRCRLLNYLVHGTIPLFFYFGTLVPIFDFFAFLFNLLISVSYDTWNCTISECCSSDTNSMLLIRNVMFSLLIWIKNECTYVFGGLYLSFCSIVLKVKLSFLVDRTFLSFVFTLFLLSILLFFSLLFICLL